MRFIRIAAVAIFCAAGALPALAQQEDSDRGSAPEPSVARPEPRVMIEPDRRPPAHSASAQHFTLDVCNGTRRPVFIALSSRETPVAREWYVAGWWNVAPGHCRSIGRFPKSTIYLHAEDAGGGKWNGRDVSICVEKQKFKRITLAGYNCDRPRLRGFYKKTITADKFTWRLTPG